MDNLQGELPPITLTSEDFEQLSKLTGGASRASTFLAREVARAIVLPVGNAPSGVVTMGSTTQFRDDETGQVRRVTLVYPTEADVDSGKISVLTPVGAALIGLSVNQSIEWETPSGEERSLTVLSVG